MTRFVRGPFGTFRELVLPPAGWFGDEHDEAASRYGRLIDDIQAAASTLDELQRKAEEAGREDDRRRGLALLDGDKQPASTRKRVDEKIEAEHARLRALHAILAETEGRVRDAIAQHAGRHRAELAEREARARAEVDRVLDELEQKLAAVGEAAGISSFLQEWLATGNAKALKAGTPRSDLRGANGEPYEAAALVEAIRRAAGPSSPSPDTVSPRQQVAA